MASFQSRLLYLFTRYTVRPVFHSGMNVQFQRSFVEFMDRLSGILDGNFKREIIELDGKLKAHLIKPRLKNTKHVILYLHGGGFIMRSPYSHGQMLAKICRGTDSTGLLPLYRLAPENPYSASFEDAVYAYDWLIRQGYAPENIAVAGDSAGGSLAMGLLVHLRDAGKALPACGVLLSPSLDPKLSGVSATENADKDAMLSVTNIRKFMHNYLKDFEADDPRLMLVDADFRGLTPLLFQTGADEVLRDDSVRAAEKALDQGVKVQLEIWPGMGHVFQAVGFLPESKQALRNVINFINAQWEDH
jgi:monoterpene epsilon-lactone hydrolase